MFSFEGIGCHSGNLFPFALDVLPPLLPVPLEYSSELYSLWPDCPEILISRMVFVACSIPINDCVDYGLHNGDSVLEVRGRNLHNVKKVADEVVLEIIPAPLLDKVIR